MWFLFNSLKLQNILEERNDRQDRNIDSEYNDEPHFNKFNKSANNQEILINLSPKNTYKNSILDNKSQNYGNYGYLKQNNQNNQSHQNNYNNQSNYINYTNEHNPTNLSNIKLEEKVAFLEKELNDLKIAFNIILDKVTKIIEVKNTISTDNVNYILEECKKMVKNRYDSGVNSSNINASKKEYSTINNTNKLNLQNLLFGESKVNNDDSYIKNQDVRQFSCGLDSNDGTVVFNERSK